jgi:colicin import membrane protein
MAIALSSCGALQQSERDVRLADVRAFRVKLGYLYRPPANLRNPEEAVVPIRILLNPDGTLAAPPKVLKSGSSPEFIASRDSALRAIESGQPFTMLKPENYQFWKEIEITFDPRDPPPRPN